MSKSPGTQKDIAIYVVACAGAGAFVCLRSQHVLVAAQCLALAAFADPRTHYRALDATTVVGVATSESGAGASGGAGARAFGRGWRRTGGGADRA